MTDNHYHILFESKNAQSHLQNHLSQWKDLHW